MQMNRSPLPVRTRRLGVASAALLPVLAVALLLHLEARQLEITSTVVRIPGLPEKFAGTRIALLADIHRGPFMSERRIARVVHQTNAQHPDVIALAGDYVHRSRAYIPSVWKELAGLRAPLGVYAVLGNHDYWESEPLSTVSMARAGIHNLTNRSMRLERAGQVLHIAGVDDPWAGKPDLDKALEDVGEDEVAIVICHNPDFIEQVHDPRAKLWLAGHTHGGQVCVTRGRPLINISTCDLRYVNGLAECRGMQIYVSRGVGTVTPPLRFNCPPEVPIIELQPG